MPILRCRSVREHLFWWMLAGNPATTHHNSYRALALQYPDIQVKRGARFVDARNVATAGGLPSGVDLALHVVERYFGRAIATSVRMTWGTRSKAGPTRSPTPCTRPSRFQRTSIRCARCARWTLILRERRRRHTRGRPTTFARPAIKRTLMRYRKNGSEYWGIAIATVELPLRRWDRRISFRFVGRSIGSA